MTDPVIEAHALGRTYRGKTEVQALRHASLTVAPGERVAILGASGAGKSTLLNLLGLLDSADSGTYRLFGTETTRLRAGQRDRLRADMLGFVFQAYHVLGHRSVRENVHLKLTMAGAPRRGRDQLVERSVESVGLGHRIDALGSTLSGGEKQRLAIARAVVGSPKVLLADEPTGNLDDTNAESVMRLFSTQAESGVSVVVITHDPRTAQWADRAVRLDGGILDA